MGFFSELKDDLSQAVNTILPSEEDGSNDPLLAAAQAEEPQEMPVEPVIGADSDAVPDPEAEIGVVIDAENSGDRTIEEVINEARELEAETREESTEDAGSLAGVDLDSMLSRIDELDADFGTVGEETPGDALTGLLEEELSAAEPVAEETPVDNVPPWHNLPEEAPVEPAAPQESDVFSEAIAAAMSPLAEAEIAPEEPAETAAGADDAFVENALSGMNTMAAETEHTVTIDQPVDKQEERKMEQVQHLAAPTDENAVITAGMQIDGDVTTSGSLDVIGKINGNVTASGKLNVTGALDGNLTAAEIYAENARITGEVRSQGAAKIGQSTVIIGNIYASSAVIAGAVKGDIDVHGPVVLDTTAIVMGNIKSQSVQINNGAVVEGMCSQAYAEVNPQAFFDGLDRQ